MSLRAMLVCAAVALAMGVAACGGPHQPRPGTVLDEAMRAGVAPKDLVRPTDDYFHDMDFNTLTWVVLKAHTNNTGGTVTLRSDNPRDTPRINFRYFQEGTDTGGEDLKAVVEGVKLVRRLTEPLKGKGGVVDHEEWPGPGYDTDEALQRYVRDHAWGHHASCTCAIGPKDRDGVLSGDFRVHDTEGLRVVDASVFPRAPGLFIISAVYMIGEKAADVIIADAQRNQPAPRTG